MSQPKHLTAESQPVPYLAGLVSLYFTYPALTCRAFAFRRFAAEEHIHPMLRESSADK